MLIGEKIKKAIEASNVTQEQVAAHAEMSIGNLYKIYKRDSVESRYLVKIAEILNLPVDYFLFDIEPEGKSNGSTIQGIGNAGKNIKNQKIMPGGKYEEPAGDYALNIEKLKHQLELCKTQKASLEKEIELKDKIIKMMEEKHP